MIPYIFHDTYVYCPKCKLMWTLSAHGALNHIGKYYHVHSASECDTKYAVKEVCPKCKGQLDENDIIKELEAK